MIEYTDRHGGDILQKIFLVADIRVEFVLGISFLTFSNADIWFAEVLFRGFLRLQMTKWVELFDLKKLPAMALGAHNKA